MNKVALLSALVALLTSACLFSILVINNKEALSQEALLAYRAFLVKYKPVSVSMS